MNNIEFKKIGKIAPSKDFKEQSKKRLMQRIKQEKSSWLEVLLRDFQKVKPERSFKLLSKERLLYKIVNPEPFWGIRVLKNFFMSKRAISLVTGFVVLFLSVFSFAIYTPRTVEASNSVFLIITEGEPIIKPLGEDWQMAQQLQELKIGDTIQTDSDDAVEIHFFDNSVTRMAHNTELTITTFFKESYSEKIELELNKGRTWNKVIQAGLSPSEFTVTTHNSTVSANAATFDIASGYNQPTAINVIDRLIDVKILQAEENSVVAKTKVAEGYKVQVQVSNKKTVAQTAEITPLGDMERDVWVTDNLVKDKEYETDLEKKREEKIIAAAGILPNSPLYKVKKGIEGAKKAVNNNDEKTEQLIEIKQKFQEAAALSAKGNREESELLLQEFKESFLKMKDNVALKDDLQNMLIEMQSDYTTVLPGDYDYQIKDLLRNLELEVAYEPSDVLQKRKTEKLFEAQDLMKDGSSDLAINLLASINDDNLILNETGTVLNEEKKDMILQKTEELQILQSLKENAKNAEADELVALVDDLQKGTVEEITKLTPQPKKVEQAKIVLVKKEDPKLEAQEFMDKIHIYKTQRGQDNQLLSLLNKMPNNSKKLSTLIEIKKLLPVEKQYLVTQKILEITGN